MNIPLLTELVSLRYRLLWASVRTRSGRIFLFVAGILLFGVMVALVLSGGIAGALAAVRSGQAERMAQGALSLLFFQAILVANLLGAGMNEILSETELRRYPLTAFDRLLARHLIGILDPFWFIYLVFYLGLALGLSAFGSGASLQAMVAAFLLLLCNYVAARGVALAVDHLTARTSGTEILIVCAMTTAFVIAFAVRALGADGARALAFYPWLRYSPAFAAARAMTQTGLPGPLIVLAWLIGLVPVLAWLEGHPPQQARSQAGGIVWDGFFDRAGECFGPRLGPLVAFWLRFHARNIITRRMLWLAPLLFGLLTYLLYRARRQAHSNQAHPNELFMAALGVIPFAALAVSWRFAANQFGYLGGGLRRLLLLPVPPASLLWSSTITSTILSLAMSLLCLTGWVISAPIPFDPRMVAMLACSALTGVFLLHAASVWVTIYTPRRGNYFLKIGNDCSLGSNAVFCIAGAAAVFLPPMVMVVWPDATSPETWWTLLPFPAVAGAVYFATLALAGGAFAGRRERLLTAVEGKG